jgi:hypothetical protein
VIVPITSLPEHYKQPIIATRWGQTPKMELIPANKLGARKKQLLARMVPCGLIPLASANGMLILGSHKSFGFDCSFPLPEFLIWGGTVSTCLGVIGIASRYIVEWVTSDNVITAGERNIMLFFEYVGLLLAVIEVVILLSGSLLIFPHMASWQHHYPHLPNYCDYSMMMFGAYFFGLSFLILTFALILSVILVFCDHPGDLRKPVDV